VSGFVKLGDRLALFPDERVEILIEWMGCTLRAEAAVTDLEPPTGATSKTLSKILMTAIYLNEPILTGKRPFITSNNRGPKSTQNMCESLRTHGIKDTNERRSAMMVVRLEVS
jgi:hypothetical protein